MASPGAATARRALAATTLTGGALLLLFVVPWRGPVVVVFSSNQGFDLGDIPVVVLLAVAGTLVMRLPVATGLGGQLRQWRRTRWGDRRLSAMATGILLLVVGTAELFDAGPRHSWVIEAGLALLVLASLGWLVAALGPDATRPALALACGVLVDALVQPSGTLVGPIVLAAYLAMTARSRWAAIALSIAIVLFAVASVASLADVAGLDVRMADGGGGPVRTAALGLVLILYAAWRGLPPT